MSFSLALNVNITSILKLETVWANRADILTDGVVASAVCTVQQKYNPIFCKPTAFLKQVQLYWVFFKYTNLISKFVQVK